ncbi:hypothetical protein M422DRAFT_248788 [Sphaerobolus stellatus SS14]|nr:hypothetical protein M422DRAFT_248788 [Sphaerobolus stellatus SS14]
METQILESSLSFIKLLNSLLEAVEVEFIQKQGELRPGGKVNLYELGDTVWKEQFRYFLYVINSQYTLIHNPSFTRAEVEKLVVVLDLPEVISCPKMRIKEDKLTAMCMLFKWLAYPSRLADISMQFGWRKSRFSRIMQLRAIYLWTRWKHLLHFDPTRLTCEKLTSFGRVLKVKGAPLDCIVGLIDDGLVIHVYGPVDGRQHDETVFKESGLPDLLNKHFWTPDSHPLFLYGDPAYSVGPHMLSPYKGPVISSEQARFNTTMSRIREPIEWIFKEVTKEFTFIDFARSQKILLTPCALYYLVALLLCNAHTILHYPQIPQYFACPPPTLEEYFHGALVEDAQLDSWCVDSVWEEVDVQDGDVEEDEEQSGEVYTMDED